MGTDQSVNNLPFQLFVPSRTALLVIDKQRAYFDPAVLAARGKHPTPNFDKNFKAYEAFIELCRQTGLPVIWTQMTEDVDASPPPIRQKMNLDARLGLPLIGASPGASDFDFYGSHPHQDDTVILKDHYDAFSNPQLAEALHARGVSSLLLTGGFASRCVLGTAYGANNHDFHCLFVEDMVFLPLEYENELAATRSIINSILGYAIKSDSLLASWRS